MNARPELVLCSPAARARETLAAIGEGEIRPELYGASAAELLGVIRGLPDDVSSVLLVGHNPGFEELAPARSPRSRARRSLRGRSRRSRSTASTGPTSRLTGPSSSTTSCRASSSRSSRRSGRRRCVLGVSGRELLHRLAPEGDVAEGEEPAEDEDPPPSAQRVRRRPRGRRAGMRHERLSRTRIGRSFRYGASQRRTAVAARVGPARTAPITSEGAVGDPGPADLAEDRAADQPDRPDRLLTGGLGQRVDDVVADEPAQRRARGVLTRMNDQPTFRSVSRRRPRGEVDRERVQHEHEDDEPAADHVDQPGRRSGRRRADRTTSA